MTKWNEEPQPASSGCSWLPRRAHQAPELWRSSIDEAFLTIRVSLGATHQAESARQTGMRDVYIYPSIGKALMEIVPIISQIMNAYKENAGGHRFFHPLRFLRCLLFFTGDA